MIVLTTAVLLRAERSAKAGIAAGFVFGLALATKLNAPFLLFVYLAFLLLTRVLPPRAPGQEGVRRLLDALDEQDDVDQVHANFDITADVMEEVAA
jgi:hypothetical protein